MKNMYHIQERKKPGFDGRVLPSFEKAMEGYLRTKTEVDYNSLDLYETIFSIMEYCVPSSRSGKILETKIKEVFGLEYPKNLDYDASIYRGKGKIEIKTSIMNIETGRFNITNLRRFNDFDFYLYMLVDSSNEFKPYFYLIPKKHIDDSLFIKLNIMNSGGKAERFGFNRGDETHKMIAKLNILDKLHYGNRPFEDNNNYNNLLNFIQYYKNRCYAMEKDKTYEPNLKFY
jgi:hypothetical protein